MRWEITILVTNWKHLQKTIDAFLVLVHEYLNLRLNTKTANIEAFIADSKCGQNEKKTSMVTFCLVDE